MELAKTYDPSQVESKWYAHWKSKGFFRSVPDQREPYTIVMPPPNVTGVLHMGHMLNNTLQDVLIRRARMQGKNACWVPGTDHASIATEAKVVAMLSAQGIQKSELTREQFLEHAWAWKEKYGGIILQQLEKLGASCDWERTRFTMEEDLTQAVLDVFVDLYNKGYIYRGVRMVNWDPAGLTAVSDEEVIYREANSQLYYVRYAVVEDGMPLPEIAEAHTGAFITIATTRPETILGDTAVCVHPEDERYRHLVGKKVHIPYTQRLVPIIADTYIDPTFGTGALKVTPAHDINDYQLGQRHRLETIDTLNPDGTLSAAAGKYVGEDRFAVRKKIAADLLNDGFLIKTEQVTNKVGHSERTNAVIEPKLSMQWFLKMDSISQPALKAVMEDVVQLVPDKFKNTYRHWMENVHDWCISRQLWWGQRIPAYYLPKGEVVVARSEAEARAAIAAQHPDLNFERDVRQDEDVLDTWFSSWLWPISVFDGFKHPNNADINYYYPTNDLITAPEILFFWVARMIIAGYEYRGKQPFSNVYLTGIVRDKLGRKMSKSLGNSPDPLDLIAQYGADAVRTGMLFSSPAGNDLLYDDALVEQGRNFSNKIWNALRLIKGWQTADIPETQAAESAETWFGHRFSEQVLLIDDHFSKYRISDALKAVYKLIWDDFCAWYLELVKPEFGQPISQTTYNRCLNHFEGVLKLVHPFMPFISEELWHSIRPRSEGNCIMVSTWPLAGAASSDVLAAFALNAAIVSEVRNFRSQKGLSPKQALSLFSSSPNDVRLQPAVIAKLCNISELSAIPQPAPAGGSFLAGGLEFRIPLSEGVNVEEEMKKLQHELEYTRGFLDSVERKLSNERFVQNAKPEVVAAEEKKKADAQTKIRQLEEQLTALTA